ncbi:hypothetical protein D3C87_1094850 [compost metagenome]
MGSSAQQIGGDCPDGWMQMEGERPSIDHTAVEGGLWEITNATIYAKAAAIELEWRNAEMLFIADQLLRIEDDDPTALLGTAAQWRLYRISVRAWVDGAENFPIPESRPSRPGSAD